MQVEILSYEIFNVAKNSRFNTVELTKTIVKKLGGKTNGN